MGTLWMWVGFNLFVLVLLALDLGILHRKDHAVGIREALLLSLGYFVLALIFGAGVFHFLGPNAGYEFFTGYLIEKSLSVDNIFVFVLIFSFFAVPAIYQHRVLFWGVLGALVMRGAMIAVGANSPSPPTPSWCSPAMSSPCSVYVRSSLPWPECSECSAT